MMYSLEKCLGRNGTGTQEEVELFTGADSGLGQEGGASDDVVLASAVAAVSHEIGDILKDELGDAEQADRIGAELADLSAELGLLAGLHDGDTQQDFPTLLKLAMRGRECVSSGSSSTSSSSWSRARNAARRPPRPARLPRRKPIAKGKEVSRRRSVAARRAASLRIRRVEVLSDASDVGADSDSDDQWTELDDNSASGSAGSSSSTSETSSKSGADLDFGASAVEPPQLRQFLLPLISNVPNSVQFRIRHDDILQLLATEEEDQNIPDMPLLNEALMNDEPDELVADLYPFEEPPVTPEEEATLLHYVCGGDRGNSATFQPTEEWLLGVFHSWCEISALIYTLIGTDASANRVCGPWAYRVLGDCHCRLCVCLARAAPALAALLRDLLWAMAHGGSTVPNAAHIMRALRLSGDAPLNAQQWDLPRLKRIQFSDEGAAIIHNQLMRYAEQNETARQVITSVCNCREFDKPMEKEFAVERFIRILECFKAASTVNFKVEMIPLNDDPETNEWINSSREKLDRYLQPYQDSPTAARLYNMATRNKPANMAQWEGYQHSCECMSPKILCAQQRKQLLRSIYSRMYNYGLKHSPEDGDDTELPIGPTPILSQKPKEPVQASTDDQLQQGDGTGAKPPDSNNDGNPDSDNEQTDPNADLDDSSFLTVTDSDDNSNSGTSLGLSHSSLDEASELLLAAAHAVDSDSEQPPSQLCRTVRHLMRSIASIERHMDTVLKQCDEWPTGNDLEARNKVDEGLGEVDRKLMAMYRRLPDVHRRQLQVYRKQKKLSAVCMQLVGGTAPPPPAPGSPPPAPRHLPCRALCPEFHLQRFKEVRRKVMHMRDQQLYYHRLRMWLEDQLSQDRESISEAKMALLEGLPRRKRRSNSPKFPRLTTATKRKLKPTTIRILQLLKQKAQASLKDSDEAREVEPPAAFPLDGTVSDTDTVVGERDIDMNQVLSALAQMALRPDRRALPAADHGDLPEAVSPPLQEMSPTTEPMPSFPPKPTQRIINKFTEDFNAQTELNAPLNARQPIKDEKDKDAPVKDPNIYKYVTFGMEIKKAMEECQDIINSYNNIRPTNQKDDGLSLEQICEVMMNLDKQSVEFLDKYIDDDSTNTKLAELVENMPQILANMPEIASEFANASFELPEFASIMTSIPDTSETQLTPETLKQIRELKLSKTRDNIKVTKNTTKRKITRKIKSNTDIIGTMTFEFDSKDITELFKDKELSAFAKGKTYRDDFKDLLYLISAQAVINKVFEFLNSRKSPDLARCLDDEIFALPQSNVNSEMYNKAATLLDNSVKDAHSMAELKESVKNMFKTWKHYVSAEFDSIPIGLLDNEIEIVMNKFFFYIQDLATKQTTTWNKEKFIAKLEGPKREAIEQVKDIQTDENKQITKTVQVTENAQVSENAQVTDKQETDTKEMTDNVQVTENKQETVNKQINKMLNVSAGNNIDVLLMLMPNIKGGNKKEGLKNIRFNYVDVIKRCEESQQLVTWILNDPDLAADQIQELMGFDIQIEAKQDPASMTIESKRECFMERLKKINKFFMSQIPKKAMTGDEWLVLLYKLEQHELKIKDSLIKFSPHAKVTQASEAEILAAKGLSKIINNANNVRVKTPSPTAATPTATPNATALSTPVKVNKIESTAENQDELDDDSQKSLCTKSERDILLECEAIIAQKGNKPLQESFGAIKSYLAGDVPKPENYDYHVMSIVANIEYFGPNAEMKEILRLKDMGKPDKGNTEDVAKYKNQIQIQHAAKTLNTLAVRYLNQHAPKHSKSGSKSDSELSCDVQTSGCKFTSDCNCAACKSDASILNSIVKISFEDKKVEEKKEVKEVKEVKKVKAKPVPKQCENANHQQHVCKVGHTTNGSACTGDGGDQHCTCCYCTVFGHAPPLTTPVPRNFNETRERLRSILNKKKQLCKTNGEPSPQEARSPQPEHGRKASQSPESPAKPPALPKTLPPNLTATAQAKRQALDNQQRMLADKMAKMAVSDKQDKPVALQRTVPVQVNVSPSLKAEGKVNANAMEQIRLQQLKQQQTQYQQQMQQKKPEPIYDLPIHNKPPQQQQQIRQEFQKQQIQKQLLQQKLKQNTVVQVTSQPQGHAPHASAATVTTTITVTQNNQQLQKIQQVQQIQKFPSNNCTVVNGQKIALGNIAWPSPKPQQTSQNQPQVVQNTPQVVQNTQQNPPQVPQNPPQIAQNPAQIPQNPAQIAQNPPQILQKPPVQQAPRKPPPQELHQKLQQKQLQAKLQQTSAQQAHLHQKQLLQAKLQPKPTGVQQAPVQQSPAQQTVKPQAVVKPQQPQQPPPQPQQPKPPARTPEQQQQWWDMQRMSRSDYKKCVPLSSRDTSVFSTSSGCSDSSCWQGRPEDTRDLDLLLQYIEGPTRIVDRGKKKAKKQRQKAKKTEEKLAAEFNELKLELSRIRTEADALRVAHAGARRRCDDTRRALQALSHTQQGKKSKKQNKLNPVQKQQIQVLAEQVGELTALMNTTAKELQSAEKQVSDCSSRLRQCEKEISEARAAQGQKAPAQDVKLNKAQLQAHLQAQLDEKKQQAAAKEAQLKQLQMQQLKQQRQLQINQELMNRIRLDEAKLLKQAQNEAIAQADRNKAVNSGGYSSGSSTNGSVSGAPADTGLVTQAGATVLVRRCGADVTVSIPGRGETPLGQLVSNNRHIITMTHIEAVPPPAPKPEPKKSTQTWEQALAHINQVAKGTKDKKKKPAAPPQPEPKKEVKPAPEEPAPLSKKQRKKLAQQQAEEEERLLEEQLSKQEAKKKKKTEPASLPVKVEPLTKKADKKLEEAKRAEEVKSKKEAKRERKLEKKAEKKEEKKLKEQEAKEKENRPEKNAQAPKAKTPPQPAAAAAAAAAPSKKERKREQQLLREKAAQASPAPTQHNKKCASSEPEKPSSCSIMEQLSCGIQVSELRLPPGITLTRVQPSEKKDPPAIKSVPLWKANQLPATPTPVARPAPVINADPSMMMFSTANAEPPKPIIVAEPPPVGKSKKAKKKAKKAAAAAETKPDPTKIVTLRNPMFHPNLPPVQIASTSPPGGAVTKKPEIRLPDPIPMPPNACQATITPTSNGMYTIRNPLMSMMHQQTMMGVRNPTPPFNQSYYNYQQPGQPAQPTQPGQYVLERTSPKPDDYKNRIMNLASFTQKNDEGYSLFSTTDNAQKSFLSPEYYGEENPKPVVSPNPIGTRPAAVERPFEGESLFVAGAPRVEPIGPPRAAPPLYTPFPQQNPHLFHNALFHEKANPPAKADDPLLSNGDLPYFQRLRVGSKLNNEVTIHHVTESKFYRQEPTHQPLEESPTDDSLFSRPLAHAWAEPIHPPTSTLKQGVCAPSPTDEPRFGAVGTRPLKEPEMSIYLPEAQNMSALEACEREVESFKRYEWYFNPDNKV